jgi:hypothetical protein
MASLHHHVISQIRRHEESVPDDDCERQSESLGAERPQLESRARRIRTGGAEGEAAMKEPSQSA